MLHCAATNPLRDGTFLRFGAQILPIVEVDDAADAVAYINARPSPLALYVFSDDSTEIATIRSQYVPRHFT